MKTIRKSVCGGIVALAALMGMTATASAQPRHRGRGGENRQQEYRETQRGYPDEERSKRDVREWQRERGWARQQGAWQGGHDWDQHRARQFEAQHRTWAERGGYGGAFIPYNRFQSRFGVEHVFRIGSRPVIVDGYPRFRYAGYQFVIVDPWPEFWEPNWYATNDVFIVYDDGYYLCNRREPSFRLAISVVL